MLIQCDDRLHGPADNCMYGFLHCGHRYLQAFCGGGEISSSCLRTCSSYSFVRSIVIAFSRLPNWLLSVWQTTTVPVGICVSITFCFNLIYILLMQVPPLRVASHFYIGRVYDQNPLLPPPALQQRLQQMYAIRPCVSVSGTAARDATPLSNFASPYTSSACNFNHHFFITSNRKPSSLDSQPLFSIHVLKHNANTYPAGHFRQISLLFIAAGGSGTEFPAQHFYRPVDLSVLKALREFFFQEKTFFLQVQVFPSWQVLRMSSSLLSKLSLCKNHNQRGNFFIGFKWLYNFLKLAVFFAQFLKFRLFIYYFRIC